MSAIPAHVFATLFLGGRELCVGASVGISIYPGDGTHVDALLKMADEEMYREKLRRQAFQTEKNARSKTNPAPVSPATFVGA